VVLAEISPQISAVAVLAGKRQLDKAVGFTAVVAVVRVSQ
jgi:hypothetical protein